MLATFASFDRLANAMLSADSLQNSLCMPRSNGQRLVSASLAVAISLFFLAQLHRDFLRSNVPATSLATRIMLLSFPTQKITVNTIQDTPKTNTAIAVSTTKRTIVNAQEIKIRPTQNSDSPANDSVEAKPATELVTVFPDVPSTNATTKPVDPLSGTARFKYDSATVRQAYEASKSDIQKLAEKSGNSLEDPKVSKHDRFQQAANRAAKPDCLRQGGSILSLFVVAYQVATDHCK